MDKDLFNKLADNGGRGGGCGSLTRSKSIFLSFLCVCVCVYNRPIEIQNNVSYRATRVIDSNVCIKATVIVFLKTL